jgi:hypothetical protein
MIKRFILVFFTVYFLSSYNLLASRAQAKESCKTWKGTISPKISIPVTIKKNQVIKVSKSYVGQWIFYNPQGEYLDVWGSRKFNTDVNYVEFFREGKNKTEQPNLQGGKYQIKYLSGFGLKESLKICIK